MTVTDTAPEAGYRSAARTGLIVAVALGVLTVFEFIIAVTVDDPLSLLLPLVVAKGLLILDFYMHVRRLFGRGGAGHDD